MHFLCHDKRFYCVKLDKIVAESLGDSQGVIQDDSSIIFY